MALKVARRSRIAPFIAMEVLRAANERQAAGERVTHLEIGEPGAGAPAPVIEAARQALGTARIGYTEALGLGSLRQRIARHYGETYGVAADPARIAVTTGSSGAFLLAFLAAFDVGDRVALAAPGYPAYRNILTALGIEPVLLPSGTESRFQPSVELLRRVEGRLDGLIVASPSNPAGTMLEESDLRQLAAHCRERGIRLVSDEIYHGITYERRAATMLDIEPEALIVNSFSKYYAMTGWRLGWLVVPDDLLRAVESLAQNLFISPPALSQLAAGVAFDCRAELDGYVARYRSNRDLLLGELPKAGFDDFAPADGAFYLYADVSRLTNDSDAFCRRMLAETGVATTPGRDFDPERGHRFLRFSFAGSSADMAEAARRLIAWRR
jgi:aspartate/methionine/tyrosine aminotransferase